MPGQPEPGAWKEARDLLLHWEALTREMGERLPDSPGSFLLALLAQRRELSRRLDALKEEYGIATWIQGGEGCSLMQQEVAAIGRRLLAEDERIRRDVQHKMDTLREQVDRLRQTRIAARTYSGCRRTVKGAFIDARR